MVACARFTGRTEKECTRRHWGCPCREEMERAFHAMRVEDIPVLADMMPSDTLAIFEAAWDASKAYEVRQAIRDYYAALAAGKNARAARDLAFLTIEEALGMTPNADVTGLPLAQTVELPPKPAGGRSELT